MKKSIKVLLIILLCVILSAGIFFSGYALFGLAGGLRLTVNTSKSFQTIEGFGASAAWWYQIMGAYDGINADEFRNNVINLVYGDDGLGINYFRYNIGGGSWELFRNNVGDYTSYNNGKGRRRDALTESFFKSECFTGDYSVFSDPNNYTIVEDENCNHDKYTQLMLKLALNTGNINKLVAFCNSPHYLLTKSGYCIGSEEYQNNLKEECFLAFSDYAIISTYKLYEGIIKDYNISTDQIQISPVNEPQYSWSIYSTDQEGCHYSPQYLAKFYQVFYERLKHWNSLWNTSFKMDIFESGNYENHINEEDYQNIWRYLKEFKNYEFWNSIDEVSLHSYGVDYKNAKKRYFNTKLKAKGYNNFPKIAISEYCDMIWGRDLSIDMALRDSRVINGDLSIMNAVSWSWWLSISAEDYNSSLVYYDVIENNQETTVDDEYVITIPKRYYAFKHYSAFIKPGDTRVKISSSDPFNLLNIYSSAYLKKDGSLVVVITNGGKSRDININGLKYNSMTTYTTTADEDWSVKTESFKNKITLPGYSIITIILK